MSGQTPALCVVGKGAHALGNQEALGSSPHSAVEGLCASEDVASHLWAQGSHFFREGQCFQRSSRVQEFLSLIPGQEV